MLHHQKQKLEKNQQKICMTIEKLGEKADED